MNIQDPISDLLVRIKNGCTAKKKDIEVYSSKIKINIIKILKKENYIENFEIINENTKKQKIKIKLKYYDKEIPMIKKIKRISKPGNKIYCKKNRIPKILNGFGLAIISTSFGILTDDEARKIGQGGEVLCTIE